MHDPFPICHCGEADGRRRMRLPLLPLVAALVLGGCAGNGPIFPVEDNLYDWVTAPEARDPQSDNAPVISGQVVTFRLDPGDRLSTLQAAEDWRAGQTRLFGFDVRADAKALGTQKLVLSRLSRSSAPAGEITSVHLDAVNGVTVMGRSCIAAEDLGDWHRVEMRIRLSNDDRGFLEVFCDRKPVWAQTEFRTTFPPVCRRREGCNTPVQTPVQFKWQVGLLSERPAPRRVSVQMRRLHHRLLLYIPNRAGTL